MYIGEVISTSLNDSRCDNIYYLEDGLNEDIANSEYYIAGRYLCDTNYLGVLYTSGEYHFIIQLSDGTWAHKMGTNPAESLANYIDTDDYRHNTIQYSNTNTNLAGERIYSNTYYFAVDPR